MLIIIQARKECNYFALRVYTWRTKKRTIEGFPPLPPFLSSCINVEKDFFFFLPKGGMAHTSQQKLINVWLVQCEQQEIRRASELKGKISGQIFFIFFLVLAFRGSCVFGLILHDHCKPAINEFKCICESPLVQ